MSAITSRHGNITDVPGIRVGHAADAIGLTGCTVVLCEQGAVGGVDQRGGAPGTRETDLLRPMHLVQRVNAVLLSGGSAFGLAAADGVMRYLEEQNIGFDAGVARVPIVPTAVHFDLDIGRSGARPTADTGYRACEAAVVGAIGQGCVGAGTGAYVGRMLGPSRGTKSGIGSTSITLGDRLVVGAIVVVNAVGDVVDPRTGEILAGLRSADGRSFVSTMDFMASEGRRARVDFGQGTVIGVVATNAQLTKEQANKVAQMAQDGVARALRPAHTMFDGDTLFSLATGPEPADVNLVGSYGAELVAQSIVRAVLAAESAGGLPAHRDLHAG